MGQQHHSSIAASKADGRNRANAPRPTSPVTSSATTGATQALVTSMSEGTAAPVIQYGNRTSMAPGGYGPTGSTSQPPRKVAIATTAGLTPRICTSHAPIAGATRAKAMKATSGFTP
jgi:hypothetical protein